MMNNEKKSAEEEACKLYPIEADDYNTDCERRAFLKGYYFCEQQLAEVKKNHREESVTLIRNIRAQYQEEIAPLKNELQAAHAQNEKLVAENLKLVRENEDLHRRLSRLV